MTNRYQTKVKYVTAFQRGRDNVEDYLRERLGAPTKYGLSMAFTPGWWEPVFAEDRYHIIIGTEKGPLVLWEGYYLVVHEDGAFEVVDQEAFSELYEESTS